MSARWDIRYARTSDGIDVAFATYGHGPHDVVLIHGFTTHLDFIGDSAWHSYWLRRLADRFRVIQLDKRGTGLSDRTLGHGSIEDRMRDVLAVMDAAGSARASIVGISEGGPMAIAFAGTYPERVNKLVLYGAFARLTWAPDYPVGVTSEVAEPALSWVEQAWGTGEVIGTFFINHAPDAAAATRSLSRMERNACTPQMATEILRRNLRDRRSALLPGVSVPTLVMHNTGDPLIPVGIGRYLADSIPGSEYVEAEGDYHCTWVSQEFEPLMDRALAFLCGERITQGPTSGGPRHQRSIATLLFTDIVGSTDVAVEVGDDRWRRLVEEHDRLASDTTRRFGGRIVKTTGDGMLALFDGPSRAIEAALDLRKALRELGLRVRAGVHTGEVERTGDDVAGVGVHVAARIMSLAGADEVLTTRTVRDLAAGSGIAFAERGEQVLKGVPGTWDVFAVAGS